MNYKYGSRDTENDKGVAELQQKLKEKGYNIAVDGIYGEETQNAVTQYQTANKLKVDGIAGKETLTSLGIGTQAATPQQTTTTTPNGTQATTAQAANQKLTQLTKGTTSTLDDAINKLYDQVINQKPFEYEPTADPTYNRYADIYARNAKLTSEDAMAQAAMLTGGFGSSYGQAVATQAYNAEMSKMNDIVPELRQQALAEYENERAKDIEALSLLLNERDYERGIYESDRAYDRNVYESDRNFQFDRDQFNWQKSEASKDRADRREELALGSGFKSWEEYVNAVENGVVAEDNNFEKGFLDGAIEAYQTKGQDGLIAYFDVYGNDYSESQLSMLGERILNGYDAPSNTATYPEDVPKMYNINDVEKYLTESLGKLTKADKKFLKSLPTNSEMSSDGVDDENDVGDAYSRYLTWKVAEYLQDRKYK